MSLFPKKTKLLFVFCAALFFAVVFSLPCLAREIVMDAGAAGLVQVSQQDTALRNSMRYAAEAILYENSRDGADGSGSEFSVSGGMGYFSHSVDTGGDIDLDGLSGLVTMTYHKPGTPFIYGFFGELFDGEFDTLSPNGASSFGDVQSYGVGLFVQYRPYLAEAMSHEPPAVWLPGLYLDASVRAGRSKMDFKSSTPDDLFKFDVSGRYYGASAGVGYVFDVSPKVAVDLYGRLVWTAMGPMDANTCQDDGVYFGRANSLRLVSGFRAGYMANERTHPYVGLALDWELMDGPDTYFECVRVGEADISGVSGLLEVGVNWEPRDDVFVNLNAVGSIGHRDSLGCTLEVRYSF